MKTAKEWEKEGGDMLARMIVELGADARDAFGPRFIEAIQADAREQGRRDGIEAAAKTVEEHFKTAQGRGAARAIRRLIEAS